MNILIILMLAFFFSMGLLYVIAHLYEKYFSLGKKRERDRAIMETLGEDDVNYSDPYFAKLSQKSRVGDNLPTRSCNNCGGALNPDDRFCAICGMDITEVRY